MPPRRTPVVERPGPDRTLLPGYLVGLKTSVTGNVSYNKVIIEPEHKVRSGAVKEKWQTERTVEDNEEHKKATALRLKVRVKIVSVCARSDFGLLCPHNKLAELNEAVAESTRLVAQFNRQSRLTRVGVYVIKGEIARDDVQAVQAIKGEVRELLAMMAEGVKNFDAKAIRKASSDLRNVGSMLAPEVADKIKTSIDAGRKAARKITKAAEDTAQEIDREAMRTIREARTAFLDIDMEDVEIGTPEGEAVTLDVEEEAPAPVRRPRRRLQEA